MDDRIKILQQTPLFANQPKEVLLDAAKRIKEEHFRSNQVICTTGEIGNSMYMVKSGEVKVATYSIKGEEIVLDYLGRGKYFGEMSLLTGAGRSACVVATLDSALYVLEKEDFEELINKYPNISQELSRVLAERLRKINSPQPLKRLPPKLLCFISPFPPPVQKQIACLLSRALKEESGKKVVFVDFNFDCPDILAHLKLPPGSKEQKEYIERMETISALEFEKYLPSHDGLFFLSIEKEILQKKISTTHYLSAIMGLIKERFDFIVVDCGKIAGHSSHLSTFLNDKFLEISDSILYYISSIQDVSAANDFLKKDEKITLKTEIIVEKFTDSSERNIPIIYNLLLKEPSYKLILNRESMEQLKNGKQVPFEIKRLARRLSGTSIGVAIGSGGVRCCAAIGILDVLAKEGIPIDLLSGSSMGAAIATLYAIGKTAQENIEFNKKVWNVKYPFNLFPLSNILNTNQVNKMVKNLVGDLHLEELNLPVFITAADIVTCEEVVFSKGLIYPIVTASVSIPALFPPVEYQNRWLVDGGVANMVPTDILKEKNTGITIAINVNGADPNDLAGEKKRLQSNNFFVKILRLAPSFKKLLDSPSIPNIVNRSIYIPNLILTKNKESSFDFYIQPEVTRYHTFDSKAIEKIIRAGRSKATEFIPEIKKKIAELKQTRP